MFIHYPLLIVNENERAVAVRNAPGPIVVPINNQATRLGNEKSTIPSGMPSFTAAPGANAPPSYAFAVGEQVTQKQNVKSQTKVANVGGSACIEKVAEITMGAIHIHCTQTFVVQHLTNGQAF